MIDSLTIRRPDDWHCHLRNGAMLLSILRDNAKLFGRRLTMGNIRTEAKPLYEGFPSPPVFDWFTLVSYRDEIFRAIQEMALHDLAFESVMGICLLDETTPEMIATAVGSGAHFAKAYPAHKKAGGPVSVDPRMPAWFRQLGEMTTNAEYGVTDFRAPALQPTLTAMVRHGLVLCIHGEKPGVFVSDREVEFLDDLVWLHEQYPELKIVLEHITTRAAINCVRDLGDNVGATVTVHHLYLTLDDVIGGRISPHNFCKPTAKRPEDLEALQSAVVNGFPRLWLGTDSAPHLRETKECSQGCAGVYMPDEVCIGALAQLFDYLGALDRLEAFSSEFGARFMGFPLNTRTISLERTTWRVPDEMNGVVPFMAGQDMLWRLKEVCP